MREEICEPVRNVKALRSRFPVGFPTLNAARMRNLLVSPTLEQISPFTLRFSAL